MACDETGVRIEGSNAYQWVFGSADAVVHRAAPTRGAVVVRETMDGHRPEVWCSDRYSAQQGHGEDHQACLAHLARDVAYAEEASEDILPSRLRLWVRRASALADGIGTFAAATPRNQPSTATCKPRLSATQGSFPGDEELCQTATPG